MIDSVYRLMNSEFWVMTFLLTFQLARLFSGLLCRRIVYVEQCDITLCYSSSSILLSSNTCLLIVNTTRLCLMLSVNYCSWFLYNQLQLRLFCRRVALRSGTLELNFYRQLFGIRTLKEWCFQWTLLEIVWTGMKWWGWLEHACCKHTVLVGWWRCPV